MMLLLNLNSMEVHFYLLDIQIVSNTEQAFQWTGKVEDNK